MYDDRVQLTYYTPQIPFWQFFFHDHVTRTLLDDNDPIEKEWLDLSDYGKSKVLKTTLDDLEKRLVLKRKKNFHPYILINVLDRIVIELNKEDESEL